MFQCDKSGRNHNLNGIIVQKVLTILELDALVKKKLKSLNDKKSENIQVPILVLNHRKMCQIFYTKKTNFRLIRRATRN